MSQQQATAELLPVLIVGAGPSGLMLAIELARRGVHCRIIDRMTARSDKSRALVVHSRTMELMRLAGIDAAFSQMQNTTDLEAYLLGFRMARLQFGDSAAKDTRFPFVTFVSQAETEKILEARLEELGVKVELGFELSGMMQDEHGVTATLRVPGGVEEIRCSYVAGCDGAHSRVRKELEMTFDGAAYPQSFLLADVQVDWDLSHDNLRVFLGPRGSMAFFPLMGASRSRLVMARPVDEKEDDRDPTLAEMEALACAFTKRSVKLSNPLWLARFRLHHRGVGVYGIGRGLVVGDAAHIHSPVGGQGMNTGLQDAVNLGWKLAFIINGRLSGPAAQALLSSYNDERHPIGQKLLATTDRMFRIVATRNLLFATVRNLIVPLVVPIVSRLRPVRFRAFRFISELGVRYRRSPLNLTPWQNGTKVPQAGNRMPDFKRDDGTWLYDEFRHGGMTIVGVGLVPAGSKHPWHVTSVPLDSVPADWGVKERALFVVRPDTHILLRLDGVHATISQMDLLTASAPWL